VHPIFQGGPAPGKDIAESRCSARIPRPSTRITNPNNIEALAFTTMRKRSGTVTGASAEASLRAAHRAKFADTDDEIEYDNDTDHAKVSAGVDDDIETGYAATEEENDRDSSGIECLEEAHRATKAMGDADRQVRLTFAAQVHTTWQATYFRL